MLKDFHNRPLNGGVTTEVRVNVDAALRKAPYYKGFLEHGMGQQMDAVALGTYDYVLYSQALRAEVNFNLRANQAESEMMIRQSRQQNPPPAPSFFRTTRTVVLTLLTAASIVLSTLPGLVRRYRSVRSWSRAGLSVLERALRSYPSALFKRWPILSAVVEQSVYALCPEAGIAVAAVEAGRELARGGGWGAVIAPFVAHTIYAGGMLGSTRMRCVVTLLHVGKNYLYVTKKVAPPARGVQGNWDVHSAGPWVPCEDRTEELTDGPIPLGSNQLATREPPVPGEAEYPCGFVGAIKVTHEGRTWKVNSIAQVQDLWDRLPEESVPNKYFAVVVWSSITAPVHKTPRSTLAALVNRVHKRPHTFMGEEDVEIQDFPRWQDVARLAEIYGVFPTGHELRLSVTEFLENTNTATRARVLEGLRLRQEGDHYPNSQKLFVKGDETLAKPNPRTVVSLGVVEQAKLVASANGLSKLLKAEVWKRCVRIGGKAVWFFYAAGRTSVELDEMMRLMMDVEYAVAVAGDDCIVKWGESWYCNDFTKFDGSRSASSIQFSHYSCAIMGMPREALDTLVTNTSFCYLAESHGYTFRGAVKHFFPTGIVLTTIVNCIDNIGFHLYVFHLHLTHGLSAEDAFARAGSELGFVQKLSHRASLWECDFLKGWWVPTMDGPRWINLPSAALKAAKFGVDPLYTLRKMHLEPLDAFKTMIGITAKSWQQIPREYPIFGALLSVFDRLGTVEKVDNVGSYVGAVFEHGVYKQKTSAYIDGMDVEEIYLQISRRYHIAVADVLECDAKIRAIESLPWVLSHPVMAALMRQDYL